MLSIKKALRGISSEQQQSSNKAATPQKVKRKGKGKRKWKRINFFQDCWSVREKKEKRFLYFHFLNIAVLFSLVVFSLFLFFLNSSILLYIYLYVCFFIPRFFSFTPQKNSNYFLFIIVSIKFQFSSVQFTYLQFTSVWSSLNIIHVYVNIHAV